MYKKYVCLIDGTIALSNVSVGLNVDSTCLFKFNFYTNKINTTSSMVHFGRSRFIAYLLFGAAFFCGQFGTISEVLNSPITVTQILN